MTMIMVVMSKVIFKSNIVHVYQLNPNHVRVEFWNHLVNSSCIYHVQRLAFLYREEDELAAQNAINEVFSFAYNYKIF